MSPSSPNMKRRMPGKDYTDPGYYFCTFVVEGRRQLFGSVVAFPPADEEADATNSACTPTAQAETCCGENVSRSPYPMPTAFPNGHSKPHRGTCTRYSPYGQLVARELQHIGDDTQYKGKIEVKGKIILPDHIHVLLYISERLPKALGAVINGFFVGCRREWKRLCGIPVKQTTPFLLFEPCKEEVMTGRWNLPDGQTTWPMEQPDGALRIFEKGFNDNVVYRAGQLDGYYQYMEANTWRWFMKDKYPQLFRKVWAKELLPGQRFDLIGNMFLLDRPWRVPVRISRFAVEKEAYDPLDPEGSFVTYNGKRQLHQARYLYPRREKTQEEILAALEPYLNLARSGATLMTPCISPGEQQVVQAAYKEGLTVVMFCFNGFSRYYHPTEAHYEACAKGLLLQLAPWQYDPGRKMTKALCEALNEMAFLFCAKRKNHDV